MNTCFFSNFDKTIFFRKIQIQLEKNGENTFYWVCSSPKWKKWLLEDGVDDKFILDISFTKKKYLKFIQNPEYEAIKNELYTIESHINLSINYIILMDRNLRKRNRKFSISYIYYVYYLIKNFYQDNNIEVIFSEVTHAAEVLSIETSKFLGVIHYNMAQLSIPGNKFTFFKTFSNTDIFNSCKETNDGFANYDYVVAALINKAKPKYFFSQLRQPQFRFLWVKKFFYYLIDNSSYNGDCTESGIWLRVSKKISLLWNRFFVNNLVKFYSPLPTDSYVLYFWQRQPEATIDLWAGLFSNQVALLKNISRCSPHNLKIFVKFHPNGIGELSSSQIMTLSRIPNLYIINYNAESNNLIIKSKAVITVTGTVGFEAAMLNKLVIMFGDMYFDKLSKIVKISSYAELKNLLFTIERVCEETVCNKEKDSLLLNQIYSNAFSGIVSDPVTDIDCISNENIEIVSNSFNHVLQ